MRTRDILNGFMKFLLLIPMVFLIIGLMMARFIICGMFKVDDVLASGTIPYSESPILAVVSVVGCMFVVWISAVVLHELGHLVFGKLTGRKFQHIGFLGFMIRKSESGALEVRRFKIRGASGYCCMLPKGGEEKMSSLFFYLIGGSLVHLMLGILSSFLFFFTYNDALLSFFLLLVAGSNMVLLLWNIVPLYSSVIENDGRRLYTFLRFPKSREVFARSEMIEKMMLDGKSLCDMPPELFEPISMSDIQTRIEAGYMATCSSRMIEEGRREEAKKLIDELLLYPLDLPAAVQTGLKCDRMVLELLSETPDLHKVEELYDKTQKMRMKAMGSSTTVQSAAYILSLLYERDTAAEGKSHYLFEYFASKTLYPAGVRIEREMMNEAKRKALLAEDRN